VALSEIEDIVVADVKCYYCGHISGQVTGRRGHAFKASRFVPRPGYQGPEIKPGVRLRCERCAGPVFLEDATPLARAESALARSLGVQRGEMKKPGKAA
jgi:hypothetical protein